jgi:cell fate regulator YaaT (PSP1 superfamily)
VATATNAKQVVAIRFQPLGKLYHFTAIPDVEAGDFVLVSTKRGREMGEIMSFITDPGSIKPGRLKPLERKATPQELVMRRTWQRKELEAMIDCRAKAADLSLSGVKIARAEYSYDGSRITFLYSHEGEEKADLSQLRSKLKGSYRKTRVELREIGPRDVAKIIGGMGACGLDQRCCSKFLTEFSPISIKMAKTQGISLNPQEITGMCGRLRCCLVYEFEQYVAARKELPKRNKRVVTPLGEGKVLDVAPMKQAVIVRLDADDRRVEFLKHEIEPYSELKALEKKANGTCDRHQNGECDCGKDKKTSS